MKKVKKLAYRSDKSYKTYKVYMNKAEKAANAMVCLINQTNYLLDRQIRKLEEQPPMNQRERWLKKQNKRAKDKEEEFTQKIMEKNNWVYTKKGFVGKKEAEKKGLEEIDPPPA